MILQKLKTDAEAYLGEKVDAGGRSPSRPTSTTASATRPRTPAASPASKSLRIINEPTASALAYGLDKKGDEEDRRLRPRRRHLRHLDPRPVARASSRCWRPTATPTSAATTSTRCIIDWLADEFKKERGHRPAQGPDGPAAPEGSGREGQDRAFDHAADRDQPAVHHGRRQRAEAPEHHADPLQAGAAGQPI